VSGGGDAPRPASGSVALQAFDPAALAAAGTTAGVPVPATRPASGSTASIQIVDMTPAPTAGVPVDANASASSAPASAAGFVATAVSTDGKTGGEDDVPSCKPTILITEFPPIDVMAAAKKLYALHCIALPVVPHTIAITAFV
jgi:hypothetical protein